MSWQPLQVDAHILPRVASSGSGQALNGSFAGNSMIDIPNARLNKLIIDNRQRFGGSLKLG
jgi:hypothetical protein